MTTTYMIEEEVNPDTLESLPVMGGRKKKDTATKSLTEQDAVDLAAMSQEIANSAAKKAFDLGFTYASERADKITNEYESKIKALSEQYTKPRTVVVGYKLNDLKPVKFKDGAMSPPKFMPWLLGMINVGKSGGKWPFLFGPAGTGKTTACELAAEILGVKFGHISCTPDMSSSFVYSRQTANGFVDSDFIKAFRDGYLFLFDEVANAPGSIMIAINNAMTNGHLYNPITGETIKRHPNFALCFADNTNGKGGTGAFGERGRLDGATLDRIKAKRIDYDTELERALCPDTKLLEAMWSLRVKLADKKAIDVVSTRSIKSAYLEQQAGFTTEEIADGFKQSFDASNVSLVDECFKAVLKAGK